jgi:hypothetical protein
MAIRISQDNSLTFTADDMGQAIDLVEQIFVDLPKAFSALGRAETAFDMDSIVRQLVAIKQIKFSKLMENNWMNVTEDTLWKIIKALGRMKMVSSAYDTVENDYIITWKGV